VKLNITLQWSAILHIWEVTELWARRSGILIIILCVPPQSLRIVRQKFKICNYVPPSATKVITHKIVPFDTVQDKVSSNKAYKNQTVKLKSLLWHIFVNLPFTMVLVPCF
jgi:hypothetical protein